MCCSQRFLEATSIAYRSEISYVKSLKEGKLNHIPPKDTRRVWLSLVVKAEHRLPSSK